MHEHASRKGREFVAGEPQIINPATLPRHLLSQETHPMFNRCFEQLTFCGRKPRTCKFIRSSFLCARFYWQHQCSHFLWVLPWHKALAQLHPAQRRQAQQAHQAQPPRSPERPQARQERPPLPPLVPAQWEHCRLRSLEPHPPAPQRQLRERRALRAARDL